MTSTLGDHAIHSFLKLFELSRLVRGDWVLKEPYFSFCAMTFGYQPVNDHKPMLLEFQSDADKIVFQLRFAEDLQDCRERNDR